MINWAAVAVAAASNLVCKPTSIANINCAPVQLVMPVNPAASALTKQEQHPPDQCPPTVSNLSEAEASPPAICSTQPLPGYAQLPIPPLEPGPWSAGLPDEVARGLGAMFLSTKARAIPDRQWGVIVSDTLTLVDSGLAAKAFALGWTAADLFGCDRRAPWHRLDRAGLMLLAGGRVIAEITAVHAALQNCDGSLLRFRRAPAPAAPPVAMLWHLLPEHRTNATATAAPVNHPEPGYAQLFDALGLDGLIPEDWDGATRQWLNQRKANRWSATL